MSVVISFVLGASFITNRKPDTFTENDMRSRVSVIFLTFIITGIMSILSGKDQCAVDVLMLFRLPHLVSQLPDQLVQCCRS